MVSSVTSGLNNDRAERRRRIADARFVQRLDRAGLEDDGFVQSELPDAGMGDGAERRCGGHIRRKSDRLRLEGGWRLSRRQSITTLRLGQDPELQRRSFDRLRAQREQITRRTAF